MDQLMSWDTEWMLGPLLRERRKSSRVGVWLEERRSAGATVFEASVISTKNCHQAAACTS